jgi:CheY-like chemotaxis protein
MEMTDKRALVVDDSKSARVVLSRMLEKYGIAVDTADSAEAALDYLRQERPDVVFMDHMMPGMDGLQAVRILKADPATATIPVMMYTSQEGELYVGQARALGAIGVLPKTVKPIDVTKVLFQLRLLSDRRDGVPSPLQPVDDNGEPVPALTEPGLDIRSRGLIEAMLREHSLELRRFMVATLDGHAQRLLAELRPVEPGPPAEAPPGEAGEPARRWGWVAALGALVVALAILGGLYWQSLETAREVEKARARLEVESTALRSTLDEVRQAGRALPIVAEGPVPETGARVEVVTVPYGEAPLAATRLDAVRALVVSLERGGFRGTVTVESVAGNFCLSGSPEAGYSPASPDQPARDCAYRGNPFDEALTGAVRQPLAFANLSASVHQRTGGGIQLTLLQGAPEHTIAAYPTMERATAGAWNEAAAANNRLEISVLPK